jgi:hypothetical protein
MSSYARRAGTCALCQTPFHVGEEIAFVNREGKNRPVCANEKTCEQLRGKRVAETPAPPTQKSETKSAPSLAPVPPAPASPPAPTKDPAPTVAVSIVRTGEERAWSLLQVTYNLGSFESVKAGVADYAKDGEDAQALAQRVEALVYSELEAQVQALRNLHARVEANAGEVST